MERVKELSNFYAAISCDHRIGPIHIRLYMALFQLYNLNGFCNPVQISRAAFMKIAKIYGIATYHACIKYLHDFGYIEYQPSFNPAVSSQVFILAIQNY